MSWIKDNKFIATLGGITLLGTAGLVVAGLQFSSKYKDAKAKYEEQTGITNDAEGLPLYPTTANEQGKRKAVAEYKTSTEALQAAFGKFRPEKLDNVSPQEFTNRLQAANNEVRAQFTKNKVEFPEAFFLGFEGYTGALARGGATGILDYELGATKELMLDLGKSRVSKLINLHRVKLVEEDGGAFKEEPSQVARPLSLELTFKASEKASREFLSTIAKSDKYYYIIRSIRISNEKKTAPLTTDAQFEVAPQAPQEAPASDSGGFVLPTDPAQENTNAAGNPAPAEAPAPVEAAPAAPVDTGKVLQQVLGAEEVYVFIRLDIMQFLPAKSL